MDPAWPARPAGGPVRWTKEGLVVHFRRARDPRSLPRGPGCRRVVPAARPGAARVPALPRREPGRDRDAGGGHRRAHRAAPGPGRLAAALLGDRDLPRGRAGRERRGRRARRRAEPATSPTSSRSSSTATACAGSRWWRTRPAARWTTFVRILRTASAGNDSQDDIVTLLWQANLAHVQLEAVPLEQTIYLVRRGRRRSGGRSGPGAARSTPPRPAGPRSAPSWARRRARRGCTATPSTTGPCPRDRRWTSPRPSPASSRAPAEAAPRLPRRLGARRRPPTGPAQAPGFLRGLRALDDSEDMRRVLARSATTWIASALQGAAWDEATQALELLNELDPERRLAGDDLASALAALDAAGDRRALRRGRPGRPEPLRRLRRRRRRPGGRAVRGRHVARRQGARARGHGDGAVLPVRRDPRDARALAARLALARGAQRRLRARPHRRPGRRPAAAARRRATPSPACAASSCRRWARCPPEDRTPHAPRPARHARPAAAGRRAQHADAGAEPPGRARHPRPASRRPTSRRATRTTSAPCSARWARSPTTPRCRRSRRCCTRAAGSPAAPCSAWRRRGRCAASAPRTPWPRSRRACAPAARPCAPPRSRRSARGGGRERRAPPRRPPRRRAPAGLRPGPGHAAAGARARRPLLPGREPGLPAAAAHLRRGAAAGLRRGARGGPRLARRRPLPERRAAAGEDREPALPPGADAGVRAAPHRRRAHPRGRRGARARAVLPALPAAGRLRRPRPARGLRGRGHAARPARHPRLDAGRRAGGPAGPRQLRPVGEGPGRGPGAPARRRRRQRRRGPARARRPGPAGLRPARARSYSLAMLGARSLLTTTALQDGRAAAAAPSAWSSRSSTAPSPASRSCSGSRP